MVNYANGKIYKIMSKDGGDIGHLKQSEKVQCECGCSVRRDSVYGHRKTQKHQDLVKLVSSNKNAELPASPPTMMNADGI